MISDQATRIENVVTNTIKALESESLRLKLLNGMVGPILQQRSYPTGYGESYGDIWIFYIILNQNIALDTEDRLPELKEAHGIGYCNITKCCTKVCPENITITDNAIIPLKERVVDEFYDPLTRLWRLVFPKRKEPSASPATSGSAPNE